MDSIEFRSQEGSEQGEGMERLAARSLDNATFEPIAYVEQTGDFQQSEALQTSLEVMVANLPSEPVVESQPAAETGTEQVGDLPIPIPQPVTDEVGSLPIPIPQPVTDEVGSLPIPIPQPVMDEVGSLPIPIPQPPSEQVGVLPTPLPQPASEQVDAMPEPMPHPPSDEVSAMPEPMPHPPSDEVSAMPEPMPHPPSEQAGAKWDPKGAGNVEIPLPGTGEAGYKEGNERLNVELPQQVQPLTGMGTHGEVDVSGESGIGVPMDKPLPEEEITGEKVGHGGAPVMYGNIPGYHGQKYGDSGMEGDSMDGMSDMPTGGGSSSSGSGLPMSGSGRGGVSSGTEEYKIDTTWENAGEDDDPFAECDNLSGYIADHMKKSGDKGQVEMVCEARDGKEYTYIITASGAWNKKEEPDDSNPTPYTGGRMGPAEPEKTEDTGKVLPGADLGGLDGTTWTADVETADDSGRFYGGIKGGDGKYYPDSGGARPIDPKRKTEDETKANEGGGG